MMINYQVTEYETDKAIVVIRKPILTDEERKARDEEIKKALVRFEKERLSKNESIGCM
jgi:hypothetical protein